jgi:RNA polymerase sigma factor (sigma-70 family)
VQEVGSVIERHDEPAPPGEPAGPSSGSGPGSPAARAGTWAESLEDAYRRLRPALVRLAYLFTGSAEVAEDAVHDAVVAASRRWATVTTPDAYLRQAVVNQARSSHRRTGRERDKTTRLRNMAVAPPLEPAVDETWAVLRALPDRQRQAVVLRYYEDLAYDEIGRLLGCRPASARSLVHRGLAKVEEALR